MSWFTRVRIDVREALTAGLRDGYAWHQALWRCFPGKDGQLRKYLSRVDERDGDFEVLMLSPDKPEVQSWGSWEPKEVNPSFSKDRRYQFALRANPTVRRVVNGCRTRICALEDLRAWLCRKGEAAGFEVEEVDIGPPVDQYSCKPGKRLRFTHSQVDFNGVLIVRDVGAFTNAYMAGIGSAKAFGFGLLLLKPLAD